MRFSFLRVAMRVILIGSLLTPLASGAQSISYYDSSGQPVKERKAALLREVVKIDDSRWEFNIYRMKGPRLVSVQTIDEEGLIPNGRYIHYDPWGNCDTLGQFINGHKEGHWEIFSFKGRLLTQLEYHTDTLVEERDSTHITGIFKPVEIQAAFPGGPPAWLHFMNRIFRYPDFAVNNGITGTSAISFLVMTDGSINLQEIYVFRSAEYSLDQEAITVIRQSPNWIPAIQAGRPVVSYKTQPIVFNMEVIGSPFSR
ncbi:MAG TPA: energy transducer TonB [Puia sp.]|nr:energy transducer TonB [Puia sp.]